MRDAPARGESLSLSDILERVSASVPGEVVSVSSYGNGSGLVYRVKIIELRGRLVRVSVRAASGQILGIEGR